MIDAGVVRREVNKREVSGKKGKESNQEGIEPKMSALDS